MQIILLDKVINLGGLGDVVKVKDGYARNFLIPQGKAKRATPKGMAEFEARRSELEKAQSDRLAAAQAIAKSIEGLTLTMARKAGIDGHLFGSVTNHDVVEALQAQGHTVEKSAVHMAEGHLKTVGEYPVQIAIHAEVVANITVTVVAE